VLFTLRAAPPKAELFEPVKLFPKVPVPKALLLFAVVFSCNASPPKALLFAPVLANNAL